MAVQSATGTTVAETNLKAGALRLPSIFMQSLTMVAPGIAALFYTPVVVGPGGPRRAAGLPDRVRHRPAHRDRPGPAGPGGPGRGRLLQLRRRAGSTRRPGSSSSWLNIIYAPLVLGAVTVFGGYVISSSLEWTGAARRLVPARLRPRHRDDRGRDPVPRRPAVGQDAGHHRRDRADRRLRCSACGASPIRDPAGSTSSRSTPATRRAPRACSSPPSSPSRPSPAGRARRRWPRSPRTRPRTCRGP